MKQFFPKSKRLIIHTGIVIIISFLMIECTLRIYHHFNPTFIFYSNSYNRYRGKPYADDYNFKLNSLGFKDKEFTEKKENVYRIIGIGDSFTFGVVPYEYNYLTLLGAQLRRAGYNAEVLNMGIPAMGPKEYLSIFLHEGLELKPDMLLLSFFVGNDFIDCLKDGSRWYSYSYTASFIYYLITLGYKYEGIIIHGKGTYDDERPTFDQKTYLETEGHRSSIFVKGNKPLAKSFNTALYYLSAINDICKKRNIKFVIVIIPDEVQINRVLQKEIIENYYPKIDKSEWDITLPNTMLSDSLTKLGINYIDLYPSFSAESNERLYRIRDTHWNIAGNQFAANIIEEYVVSFLKENPKYRHDHAGR